MTPSDDRWASGRVGLSYCVLQTSPRPHAPCLFQFPKRNDERGFGKLEPKTQAWSQLRGTNEPPQSAATERGSGRMGRALQLRRRAQQQSVPENPLAPHEHPTHHRPGVEEDHPHVREGNLDGSAVCRSYLSAVVDSNPQVARASLVYSVQHRPRFLLPLLLQARRSCDTRIGFDDSGSGY